MKERGKKTFLNVNMRCKVRLISSKSLRKLLYLVAPNFELAEWEDNFWNKIIKPRFSKEIISNLNSAKL